jgi:hypothetical protein
LADHELERPSPREPDGLANGHGSPVQGCMYESSSITASPQSS